MYSAVIIIIISSSSNIRLGESKKKSISHIGVRRPEWHTTKKWNEEIEKPLEDKNSESAD